MEEVWTKIIIQAAGTGFGSLVLVAVVYYLVRQNQQERDKRIEALERRSKACEDDRVVLHAEMSKLQEKVQEIYTKWIEHLQKLASP